MGELSEGNLPLIPKLLWTRSSAGATVEWSPPPFVSCFCIRAKWMALFWHHWRPSRRGWHPANLSYMCHCILPICRLETLSVCVGGVLQVWHRGVWHPWTKNGCPAATAWCSDHKWTLHNHAVSTHNVWKGVIWGFKLLFFHHLGSLSGLGFVDQNSGFKPELVVKWGRSVWKNFNKDDFRKSNCTAELYASPHCQPSSDSHTAIQLAHFEAGGWRLQDIDPLFFAFQLLCFRFSSGSCTVILELKSGDEIKSIAAHYSKRDYNSRRTFFSGILLHM